MNIPIVPKDAPCLIIQHGGNLRLDEFVTQLLHPFARVRSIQLFGREALEIVPIFPVRKVRECLARANIGVLG